MKTESTGWVIYSPSHTTSGSEIMIGSTFRRTRREAIREFIYESGSPWKYWKEKFNFKCVKAKSTIELL